MTIRNFGQIAESKPGGPPALYRGAQPTYEQFAELKAIGVGTVIDLRAAVGRESEAIACKANDIIHANVPMGEEHLKLLDGLMPPSHAQVKLLLAMMTDQHSHGGVFVHCEHGQDRTGAAIAIYRMVVDHWSNAEAMAEAHRFGLNPLQIVIKEFIEHFDPAPYLTVPV